MLHKIFAALLRALCLTVLCAAYFGGTAFAADGTDWEAGTITATGYGVAPENAVSLAQANQMGYTAAEVVAQRELARAAGDVFVTSETTVRNTMTESDVITSRVNAVIRGARVVDRGRGEDGSYWVTLRMPLFGASSLAQAVLPETRAVERFPEPTPSVAPAEPNVNVNVTVQTGQGSAAPPTASAPAPAGYAQGGFTGLIVDCRGLELRPVMSPVIKNADGAPIYGYKNLDSKKVVQSGMAGYVRDLSAASRAGQKPLVVKAVAVENHNGNPVVSVADANRILIENRASGFLDNCAVVFVR